MKHTLPVILCCMILSHCQSGKEVEKAFQPPPEYRMEWEDCIELDSIADMDSTFPFDRATEIEFVSFPRIYGRHYWSMTDINALEAPSIYDRKILGKEKYALLHWILFGLRYKVEGIVRESFCYNPHHAILFKENTRIIAILEICFECSMKKTSQGLYFPSFCHEKYALLQRFIEELGLEYDDEEYSKSYEKYREDHPIEFKIPPNK